MLKTSMGGRIWGFSFTYVILCGSLLQLVVIPMTPWHGGDGLMAGGDWLWFHQLAVELSARIADEGWQAWHLKPEGQAPAGIAALIYAATGVAKPWVVLPVNAVLFASSIWLLYRIVLHVFHDVTVSAWASISVALMPSLAMVWGQFHKDIWALFGLLCVVAGCVLLPRFSKREFLLPGILLLIGNLCVWLVRPYALTILLTAQLLLFCPCVVWYQAGRRVFASAIFLFGVMCSLFVAKLDLLESKPQRPLAASQSRPATPCEAWNPTESLGQVDTLLKDLACARHRFIVDYTDAGSNIDVGVKFDNAQEAIAYIPRAMWIGLFAPFPQDWFANAKSPGGRVFRLVSGLEMTFLYIAVGSLLVVAGFGLLPTHARLGGGIWVLVGFSLVWMTTYALVVSNIGTLYRFRIPVHVLLCALGAAAIGSLWKARHR